MEITKVIRIFLKTTVGLVLVIVAVLGVLLYIGNSGVPFVEGDHVVSSGSAYEFRIGMTKPEVFESIQRNYAKKDYYLRVLWLRHSHIAKELEGFETKDPEHTSSRKFAEYKALIQDFENVTPPLVYTDRWDIKMPADWVNTIYLKFENDSLIEIQKSRWLFERP